MAEDPLEQQLDVSSLWKDSIELGIYLYMRCILRLRGEQKSLLLLPTGRNGGRQLCSVIEANGVALRKRKEKTD